MRYTAALRRLVHSSVISLATLASIVFLASLCAAQAAPSSEPPKVPGLEDLNRYPGLLPAFNRLTENFQHDVKFPTERSRSTLLPLLPSSTVAYMAVPNYGDTAHQALTLFRQELQESPDLRAWWTHGAMLAAGPKIEDSLDRFSQVSAYLGDEIVVAAALDGREPNVLVIAEIRKPGLKSVLQQTVVALADKSNPGIHIVDPQHLATVTGNLHDLFVLVRPDYVIASTNLATLRGFSASLDSGSGDFVSTPFAQRILKSYENGVSLIAAIDLQRIVGLIPPDPGFATFQHSGFAEVKYAVWEHGTVNGRGLSQAELSFNGPRRGIPAWLAAPAPIGSLDFVSPHAVIAVSVLLNNPPRIFDDIRQLAAANPAALANLTQMEHAFGISLKDDVFSQLTGDVTLEVDKFNPPIPIWKAILHVKDAARLQQTLATMLTASHLPAEKRAQGGVDYYTVRVSPASEIGYAFLDGYLLVASSPDALGDVIRVHQSGDSLAKSHRFQAALPPGYSGASAIFYQDPTAMMAMQLSQIQPDTAAMLSKFTGASTPAVVCAYGEKDAIREVSTSPSMDAGVVLVGAAIAIPNLLRSRTAANEASAVGKIRTMNVAQVVYASTYPDHGFASDLATLGPDPKAPAKASAEHAGLLDDQLGNPSCTAGHWCEHEGYRFLIKATCGFGTCNDFVAIATPVAPNTGSRSFCSTSDGVIRFQIVPPLTTPISVTQCKRWPPLR